MDRAQSRRKEDKNSNAARRSSIAKLQSSAPPLSRVSPADETPASRHDVAAANTHGRVHRGPPRRPSLKCSRPRPARSVLPSRHAVHAAAARAVRAVAGRLASQAVATHAPHPHGSPAAPSRNGTPHCPGCTHMFGMRHPRRARGGRRGACRRLRPHDRPFGPVRAEPGVWKVTAPSGLTAERRGERDGDDFGGVGCGGIPRRSRTLHPIPCAQRTRRHEPPKGAVTPRHRVQPVQAQRAVRTGGAGGKHRVVHPSHAAGGASRTRRCSLGSGSAMRGSAAHSTSPDE